MTSERKGRTRECRLGPAELDDATRWIQRYHDQWERRLDRLQASLDERKGGDR